MYNPFGPELAQAQQAVLALHKIDAQLRNLTKEQKELEQRKADLGERLRKEDTDVERLENRSISSLFYSISGRLDEMQNKERMEALDARLKYGQAVRDLEAVLQEISGLSALRGKYEGSEERYAALYVQKKEFLLRAGSGEAGQLLDSAREFTARKNNAAEIQEALAAGKAAASCLDQVRRSLAGAADWGTWDLMGGGMLAGMAKHADIDDAEYGAQRAQELLRRFRTELADVRIDSNVRIEIGSFAKFADLFFDGLLADWCIQSAIHEAKDNVEKVREQVQQVIEKLSRMADDEYAQM